MIAHAEATHTRAYLTVMAKAAKAAGDRKLLEVAHLKQHGRLERRLAAALDEHFAESVAAMARHVARGGWVPDPARAREQAERLAVDALNVPLWQRRLRELVAEPLVDTFVEGALAELTLDAALRQQGRKKPAVVELEELLGQMELPDWLFEAAMEQLTTSFSQDYWLKIPRTTRDDVQATLETAIEEGLSIRKIRDAILEKHGDFYTKARATAVARTETTSSLSAGHQSGISQLAAETGLDIRAEWLSVLGPTTRPSHAALHGVLADDNGMFDMEGILIPWPAHHDLPPDLRVNCQCVLVSNLSSAEIQD
jgi:hypothetical protein